MIKLQIGLPKAKTGKHKNLLQLIIIHIGIDIVSYLPISLFKLVPNDKKLINFNILFNVK